MRTQWSERYPHIAFRHCCGAGGLAVLSKFPFDEVAYLQPPPDGWFPGWLLIVHTPHGDLQLLNVHLRPPLGDKGGIVRRAISGALSTKEVRERQLRRWACPVTRMPTPRVPARKRVKKAGSSGPMTMQGRKVVVGKLAPATMGEGSWRSEGRVPAQVEG